MKYIVIVLAIIGALLLFFMAIGSTIKAEKK
ncbi:hypothetical protein Dester_1436 [Desulfurobacterium thermolithotrophum DSM 11699]|uniref:Uncharacterized protein n=1 Tax=Desulfurobacterium thermolithotrophum (strain DSM 11699 / BSA) TaxID=868864 RepID=F0S1Y5_DESTD|nr:hypothetical protein Dester_1436 [Desulfurobacterium thermolithotrophum DSM 11699]